MPDTERSLSDRSDKSIVSESSELQPSVFLFDHFSATLEEQKEKLQPLVQKFFQEHTHFESGPDLDLEIVDFINSLVGEKFTLTYRPSDQRERISFPPESQVDWLTPRTYEIVRDLCVGLITYHNLPIITDNLNEKYQDNAQAEESVHHFRMPHSERRANKQTLSVLLGPIFRQLVDDSKLRNQNFFFMNIMAESIPRRIAKEGNSEKAHALASLFESYPQMFSTDYNGQIYELKDDYKNWPPGAQLRLAETVNARIEEFVSKIERLFESPPQITYAPQEKRS